MKAEGTPLQLGRGRHVRTVEREGSWSREKLCAKTEEFSFFIKLGVGVGFFPPAPQAILGGSSREREAAQTRRRAQDQGLPSALPLPAASNPAVMHPTTTDRW